jgi:ferredoxin
VIVSPVPATPVGTGRKASSAHQGEEIAPDVFFGMDDGLFYVKESADNFGSERLFDGSAGPAGAEGMARIPEGGLERVIEAAEECPGECIFIEVDG